MKIMLVDIDFRIAAASLVAQLEEKDIEVIVIDQIEKEEKRIEEETTIISSHMKESVKVMSISDIFIDDCIKDIPINKKHHKRAIPINNTHFIKKSFIQKRHVPTNRGK